MKKKFMAALAMLALGTSMFTGCGASTQTVSEKTPAASPVCSYLPSSWISAGSDCLGAGQ